MMDQMIIITLVLISTLSIVFPVNGQLRCFDCTNCPNVDELDESMSRRCDFVPSPSTPDTSSTTDSETTPITPTSTFTAPTPTQSPLSVPTLSSENNTWSFTTESPSPTYENRNTSVNSQRGSKEILLQRSFLNRLSPSNRIYLCFRVSRNVHDTTEVVRGCVVATNSKQDTCNRANNGVAPLSCGICDYDDCNTAKRNPTASIIIIFTSIVTIKFIN